MHFNNKTFTHHVSHFLDNFVVLYSTSIWTRKLVRLITYITMTLCENNRTLLSIPSWTWLSFWSYMKISIRIHSCLRFITRLRLGSRMGCAPILQLWFLFRHLEKKCNRISNRNHVINCRCEWTIRTDLYSLANLSLTPIDIKQKWQTFS